MVALNAVFSKDAAGQLIRALADTDEQGEALANLAAATAAPPPEPESPEF